MNNFRQWLIDRLVATRYATDPTPDDKIDEVAAHIGVQPDTLLEARVRAKILLSGEGRQPRMGPKKKGTRHYQVKLFFPEQLYVAWKKLSEDRGVDSTVLLRSIIHAYLLGSYEPGSVANNWYWKGHKLPAQYNYVKNWPFAHNILLTNGARRALEIRARRRGASRMGILRGLVIETLEGKFAKHGHLEIVDARTMYDDERRYYLGGDE